MALFFPVAIFSTRDAHIRPTQRQSRGVAMKRYARHSVYGVYVVMMFCTLSPFGGWSVGSCEAYIKIVGHLWYVRSLQDCEQAGVQGESPGGCRTIGATGFSCVPPCLLLWHCIQCIVKANGPMPMVASIYCLGQKHKQLGSFLYFGTNASPSVGMLNARRGGFGVSY